MHRHLDVPFNPTILRTSCEVSDCEYWHMVLQPEMRWKGKRADDGSTSSARAVTESRRSSCAISTSSYMVMSAVFEEEDLCSLEESSEVLGLGTMSHRCVR
jgi:hypothetical protein